jgi:hypothetical protein
MADVAQKIGQVVELIANEVALVVFEDSTMAKTRGE